MAVRLAAVMTIWVIAMFPCRELSKDGEAGSRAGPLDQRYIPAKFGKDHAV